MPQTAQVSVPKIARVPRFADFLTMRPSPEWEGRLAKITGFIQRAPDDGQPATEKTEAYLGYDDRSLYVIFVAFDGDPHQIRARLTRRESLADDDDQVGIYLDTFHDRRRAYQFECNALGVQLDSTYSEDIGKPDTSFDTVWDSRGALTGKGYVVWMRIPFKSLRFQHSSRQAWGIALWRWIGRRSEGSWWPRVTFNRRGILPQEATANGFERISPGRNLQLIPYANWRAFHAINHRDPAHPVYEGSSADVTGGIDAKIILKDSLVLDLTAKPDFSQVESDEPQSTINQPYETFFPEKRPFFTENANFFEVPMQNDNRLLFTRRIADPDFGVRLTGRLGPYSVGTLVADDRSLGQVVPRDSSLAGSRAYFDVFRLSRDLGQSNVGTMYTERRLQNSYNRVFDLDTTLRLNSNWTAKFMGANSWTQTLDGISTTGRAFEAGLVRESRGFNYDLHYVHHSPDFRSDAGFIRRADMRYISQELFYKFWRQDALLTSIKPQIYVDKGWDFQGSGIFWTLNPTLSVEVKNQTTLKAYTYHWSDTLRPKEYAVLRGNKIFREEAYGFSVVSSQLRHLTFNAFYEWGSWLNYFPPPGHEPLATRYGKGQVKFAIFASRGISIENLYLFDHNLNRADRRAIYNSHRFRSKLNWQWNRQLSFRLITQYDSLLANPSLTSNATARGFNADFLITYLVHPGTAIYVGYNSNLSRPGLVADEISADRFVNDGRQFFVKLSYLFRF